MYQNILQDRFNPGTDLTAATTAQVDGKTFLKYSGAMKSGLIQVATADAGGAVAGVAKYDAETNDLVGVARGNSRILTVTAGGALAAGDAVAVGTSGKAVKATSGALVVGYAVDDAADGSDALVSLAN